MILGILQEKRTIKYEDIPDLLKAREVNPNMVDWTSAVKRLMQEGYCCEPRDAESCIGEDMFRVKTQEDLNKSVFDGFAFIESDAIYAVRLNNTDCWVAIPTDVLPSEKEPGMNSDELIGKLLRMGYRSQASILVMQCQRK